jgi:hypothetical protein
MTSPTRSGCARRERFEPQPPDPESGGGRKASVVPVREEPEDAGRREILNAELTKILSQDQAFKAEVQALVEQAQAAGVVRVTASGDAGVVAGGNVTQWAGGNIVTGHNIGGDQVGGDKITHVYNGPTYVYEGPAYPRLTYQNEAGPLVAFYTKVFVGSKARA